MTDIEALDLKRLFHPNTNLAVLHKSGPFVLARGEGIHVWDDHGNKYIEGMAGLWCTTLGYGDEELAQTAYKQIKTLSFTHLFAGKSHEPAVRLADKLVELVTGRFSEHEEETNRMFRRYLFMIRLAERQRVKSSAAHNPAA